MSDFDDSAVDGIDLPDIPPDNGPSDDMGIPFAGDDGEVASQDADLIGPYGATPDISPGISRYTAQAAPKPAPQQKKLPPVYRALAVIFQRNVSGTLNISVGDETFMTVSIKDARVINISHADLNPNVIGDLVLAAGLVTESGLRRALRKSKSAGVPLDQYLASTGQISPVTIQNLIDLRCTELLLSVMAEWDLDVAFIRTRQFGVRRNCQLPLPFLLKEYQRREHDLPGIMARIPDDAVSFVRTSALESEPQEELWEDLEMGAAEKQIYFFVDGRRTIDDIATATGQSRFSVMRGLSHLMSHEFVVASVEPRGSGADHHALRLFARAGILLVVFALVCFGMFAALLNGHYMRVEASDSMREMAWGSLFARASEQRVVGAALTHSLMTDDVEPAPDRLLDNGLILPADIQAAVSMYRARTEQQPAVETQNTVETPATGDTQPQVEQQPAADTPTTAAAADTDAASATPATDDTDD